MQALNKNTLVLLAMATVFTSCTESNKSKPNTGAIEIPGPVKNIENREIVNDKDIYATYKYADSDGRNIVIQNGFPRGGFKYTDKKGDSYIYAVFWTEIMNETNNPLELKIDFPLESYEVPAMPGNYYEVLIPADTMTFKKFSLPLYGLKNLETYLDNNIHESTPLTRVIYRRQSSGFYVVILCLTEGAHGTVRTELSLKGQDLFYGIKVDGSKSNSKSSDMKVRCGSINLKNMMLQK